MGRLLSAGRYPAAVFYSSFLASGPRFHVFVAVSRVPTSIRLLDSGLVQRRVPSSLVMMSRASHASIICNIPSIALFALSSQRSDERDAAMVYDVYTNRGRKKSAAHIMLLAVHFLISIFSLFVLSPILLVDMMITSDVVHVMRNARETDT
jgi:hypothetical protein